MCMMFSSRTGVFFLSTRSKDTRQGRGVSWGAAAGVLAGVFFLSTRSKDTGQGRGVSRGAAAGQGC